MTKVMVFGVFDSLHEGHRYFLGEAKKLGDYLIVAVACDEVVEKLKGKRPQKNLEERMKNILENNLAKEVVPGDAELGVWEVLKKHKPHIIALGYDQISMKDEIERVLDEFDWRPETKIIGAHKPEKFHSSFLQET